MKLLVCNIGRSRYADTWRLQQEIFEARAAGQIPDVLLLTEHEHVFTLGKTADRNHLLAGEQELSRRNIDLFDVDRGGDLTYHGPGQLVGYPIIGLDDHYHDTHRYLRELEEVLIQTIGMFGLAGTRHPEYTGVWVGGEKIAAIGVKVSRWTTMHGFALNVNTDLSLFDRIIPCGIFHKGVTSMQQLTGAPVSLEKVAEETAGQFSAVFHSVPEWITAGALLEMLEPAKEFTG